MAARVLVSVCELFFYLGLEPPQRVEDLGVLKDFLA
jgi:hypothetical protein